VKIITATESIPVDHPVFLIFGQPGIGKSSLGYSMPDVLTLDFDRGAHRAANRQATLVIDSWKDVAELMTSADVLADYKAVCVDTVGRCLDFLIADIAQTDPKKAPGGNLSQQGWGVLKNRFRTWTSQLRALGKDVLLIAHDKEDKDGETRVVRPDIVGGSYAEVMKISDFVGYLSMNGRDRVLDFNPTDRWIGKNPGKWDPFKLPPVGKAQTFMADLYQQGRQALGNISEESATITAAVAVWRTKIDGLATLDQCNAAIAETNAIVHPNVQAQAKKLLLDRGKALGFTVDTKSKTFVPAPVAVPA
jgi:hypothetical protein